VDAELISAIGSVAAALGTAVAVAVAVTALQTSRRTALADQFLGAVGDMLAALAQVSERAGQLNRMDNGEETSRQHLGDAFSSFAHASARIGLLEPALSNNAEYGEWVRAVANNLAANLLQADEFQSLMQEIISDEPVADEFLGEATPPERALLNKSLSFRSVTMIDLDPPDKIPKSFQPPMIWWAQRIVEYGGDGHVNVYSPDATYLTQNSRLLDDFVREYMHPWAQEVVRKGLR